MTTADDGDGDGPFAFDVAVVAEAGRFAVDVVAVYPDGAVRRRIATYPSRRRAEVAARMITKGAERPGFATGEP